MYLLVAYIVSIIAGTFFVHHELLQPPRISPDLSLCQAKDVDLAPSWPAGPVTRITAQNSLIKYCAAWCFGT